MAVYAYDPTLRYEEPVNAYVAAVRGREFPSVEHTYAIDTAELERLRAALDEG